MYNIPENILAKRVLYKNGFLTTVTNSQSKKNKIVFKYPINENSQTYVIIPANKKQQKIYTLGLLLNKI